jgi:hypothetical protein
LVVGAVCSPSSPSSSFRPRTDRAQSNFTSSSTSSHQFNEFFIKTPRFNLIIAKLTHNTFVLAVLPPGEAELNCTRINIATARDAFVGFDTPIRGNRSEVSSMRNTPHGSYGR